MNQSQNSQEKKETINQTIKCPWIAIQPYPSPINNKKINQKRKTNTSTNNNCWNNNSMNNNNMVNGKTFDASTFPSMQHSSNQFFLFLRLMQLFPQTHPATLHTVLYLCKNDFFCAVDKLLCAKRCKMLYTRRNQQQTQQMENNEKSTNHQSTPIILNVQTKKRQETDDNTIVNKKIRLDGDENLNDEEKLKNTEEKRSNLNNSLETEVNLIEPKGTIKFIKIKASNIQCTKVNKNNENV